MFLSRLQLDNFRCFSSVELRIGKSTFLIGGNATGKTSVLEAIDKVFGAGQRGYAFREEDLASGAESLSVLFEIRPDDQATFSPEEHALFETHVDIDDEDNELVLIRATGAHEDDGSFRTRAVFVKLDGEEDGVLDIRTRDSIGFFYLPAARDARRELDDRGGIWSRLAGLLERADDPLRVEELSADAGRELVAAVLGEERLTALGATVSSFVEIMYGDEAIDAELRATAIDFRTLLRRASLMVGNRGSLAPLDQHSTGLQTLALFGLFRAYLESTTGHLLAAGLEEPEIHLAPHVARSLVDHASKAGSQVLFTSHSPAITNATSVDNIRVLHRRAGVSVVRAVAQGLFDEEQLARLHRELKTVGTEFLFARAVLLCEGASELGAIPEFAALMQVSLDRVGVSIVPVSGSGFLPYLKLLGPKGFDIPHAVLCDNDGGLRTLIRNLSDNGLAPEGVNTEDSDSISPDTLQILRSSGFFAWPVGDLETFLVQNGGYEKFVEAADFLYGPGDLEAFRKKLEDQGQRHDEASTVRRYSKLRRVRKPELAAETARRFEGVPDEMASLITYVTRLTNGGVEVHDE